MNPYLPNTLAGVMPWSGASCSAVYLGASEKPNNPDQIAPYQKYMNVIFVPGLVNDLKALAKVSTIHALFTDPVANERLALSDRAYLLAFHDLVSKALGLNAYCSPDYQDSSDVAVRLSGDTSLRSKIENQYFHQYSLQKNDSVGAAPLISTECHDLLGASTNYVVLSPGALTSVFEPGCAPPMDEMMATICAQQLRILRECLKPFNLRNTKESIAMCDPSGTFSAYLALLNAAQCLL